MNEIEERSKKASRTPAQIIWAKLQRNRTAMAGLLILAFFYFAAIFAGFLSPYHYDTADHDKPFHPPMLFRIHFFDEQDRLSRPFVYGITPEDRQLKTYSEDKSQKYPIRFFTRGDSYHILWLIRSDIHLYGVEEPGRFFLFGSDKVVQD